MSKHTVECPQCGASYEIDETKLGKKGRCSKCGNSFTLALSCPDPVEPLVAEVVDEQPSSDPLSSLAAACAAQGAAAPPPKRKSFFEKAKKWADAAARQVHVVYVQGPWGIKANSQMTMILNDSGLVLRVGIINKQEFFVPYEAITGMTVDTAERMTLTRALLVGIFAFGLKKKDKFLKLDFQDDTATAVSAIFGKGPGCDVPTLQGRISQAKHDYLAACPEAAVVEAEPVESSATTDIFAAIENLAQLRDKGILSEEEFQQKKAELLSRL
jgi:predicted Zn finger-like uncharacterized protein